MKHLLALIFAASSFSAMATGLPETIRSIEVERNAKCSETRTSFGLCLGTANGVSGTCFYSVKLLCEANTGDFWVRVKMKRVLGKTKVRKVIYL